MLLALALQACGAGQGHDAASRDVGRDAAAEAVRDVLSDTDAAPEAGDLDAPPEAVEAGPGDRVAPDDPGDASDPAIPPPLSREAFHQLVAEGDPAALAAFLDAYDMPVCDGGVCLFVMQLPQAQAVEVRGSWDGWSAGWPLTRLAVADTAGRRPWTAEIALTVDPVVQYKVVADGEWLLDPSNRYFRFAEYGPNSAISAPSVGRLTRLDGVASPQLGNQRALYVYLPAAYFAEPQRRFGVLYLQDGFNVFTNPLATFGSWDVDATADLRMGQGLAEPLVLVGVDTAARYDEYTWCAVHVDHGDGNPFWTTPKLPAYADFLVGTVVPLVDDTFRTLPEAAHRGIAGSSLGGVSSFWIAWHHPEAFSRAGVFSPSTWIGEPDLGDDSPCPSLRALVEEGTGPGPTEVRFYLDSGDTGFDGASTYGSDSWAGTDWTRNALIRAGWSNRAAWDTDGDPGSPPVDLAASTPPGDVPAFDWAAAPPAAYAGWADYLGTGRDLLSLVGRGHVHNEGAWKQRFDGALVFLFPGEALP